MSNVRYRQVHTPITLMSATLNTARAIDFESITNKNKLGRRKGTPHIIDPLCLDARCVRRQYLGANKILAGNQTETKQLWSTASIFPRYHRATRFRIRLSSTITILDISPLLLPAITSSVPRYYLLFVPSSPLWQEGDSRKFSQCQD